MEGARGRAVKAQSHRTRAMTAVGDIHIYNMHQSIMWRVKLVQKVEV
jgi:hypothetical protein